MLIVSFHGQLSIAISSQATLHLHKIFFILFKIIFIDAVVYIDFLLVYFKIYLIYTDVILWSPTGLLYQSTMKVDEDVDV